MPENVPEATFHRQTELEAESPTLIEGLPGTGLVASITADHVTSHLDLDRHGTIRSDAFPPSASFTDGLTQDSVRVYAGGDPDVMTLQSDIPMPPQAFPALNECVLDDLADEFGHVIFIAGVPAESQEDRGTVQGVGTTEERREALRENGIDVAEESGVVGGVTGSLVSACHHADVPATLLLTHVHPQLPDPGAAQSVIENALEPLVDFDVDTQALEEQEEEIQRQKQQVLQQLQQLQQGGGEQESPEAQTMFE